MTGALQQSIDRLDREVHQPPRSEPAVKVLTGLPGVRPFTALALLAEIGDITRFDSARTLASRAEFTPTVRGGDRTIRHGHISKMACAGRTVPLRRPGGARWQWLQDSICTGVS